MNASFEGAVAWAHRRRVLVFAGAAVLLAFSLSGLRHITFDANVLRLLPAHGEAIPAFHVFLEQFGTLDDLYVVFTAPESVAIDEYDAEIERWVAALRALPHLTRVDSGQVDGSRDWSWLLDRELLLLQGTALDTAVARLQPTAMPATLASTRELLTIPSADVAAMVRDDPLGFHELVRRQFGPQSVLPLGTAGDGYVSADGRQRLIVARPTQPPYDADFSRELFDRLDEVARSHATPADDDADPRPPLDVTFAGGHRIAVEAESVVKRESVINAVGSLALILPMLFVVFRSAWLVVIGALPSAVALLVVLGMMGLASVTLSAAATGASAMLFGLGIDGVVLLYVAHHHAVAEGRDPEAAIRAIGGPAASMLLGMWTTAATFLGLLVVDFPSLEQLGLLIGLSMIVCGVLTLLLVPASLPSHPPRRLPRSLALPRLASFVAQHRLRIVVAAAFATLVLGYFATTLRVDVTLDRLRAVTTGARLVEDVTRAFGLPSEVFVVLARGSDLERLLGDNEHFVTQLRRQAPAMPLQAPTALLPSTPTQVDRLRKVQAGVHDLSTVRTALERAALDAGFRADSFAPFLARLPRLVNPGSMITYEGFAEHGLQDVVDRFVRKTDAGWLLATYAFPSTDGDLAALRAAAAGAGSGMVLTGLPIVNEELSARFVPQFVAGLALGTVIVLISIVATFKDLRLSLLTLVPTVLGLVWAAGLLGLVRAELDLFSVFAVITFIGIGVDYGIHLVHRYRERGDAATAIAELAPVILVAGGITLFGYSTLIASSYPPLRSIGIVSAVSVVTLVIASVFVLPALLSPPRSE
jgi:predicted RND superfamily exporter protein